MGYNRTLAKIRETGGIVSGTMLKHSGFTLHVYCQTCGELPGDDFGNYDHYCHEAMRHAAGTGHYVAVDEWKGAVYGPEDTH